MKISFQRLQGPALRVRIILLLSTTSPRRCYAKLPQISSCLYRESTPRFMRAHQIGIPLVRGAQCLTSYRNMGRHTCSVDPKVAPFCVGVGVGVVVVQGGGNLRNPGLTTCPQ